MASPGRRGHSYFAGKTRKAYSHPIGSSLGGRATFRTLPAGFSKTASYDNRQIKWQRPCQKKILYLRSDGFGSIDLAKSELTIFEQINHLLQSALAKVGIRIFEIGDFVQFVPW